MVAIVAAVLGYFLIVRGLSFAGHALSSIGFAGAAGAVLLGVSPIYGLMVFTVTASIAISVLGREVRERDVATGVIMTFALGLGILFLSLYHGYAEQAYSILFGTIVGVSRDDVVFTFIIRFDSIDRDCHHRTASAFQLLRCGTRRDTRSSGTTRLEASF